MESTKADTSKPRTLEAFLLTESVNITDYVKQRKSVDLEKLFFGQDGYQGDDDDEDDGKTDVKDDGVEKSETTEKPKVLHCRKPLRQAM